MAQLKEMIKRPANHPPRKKKASARPMAPRPAWNATPHRSAPPALRGLRTTREPWAKEDEVYTKGMEGHGAVARSSRPASKSPTREEQEKEYRDEYNKWLRRTKWNPTPFRNAPDQIRGLKPMTREPWYEDMAIVSPAAARTHAYAGADGVAGWGASASGGSRSGRA